MSAKESIKEQFKEGALEYKRANEICRLLGAGSRGERDAIGRMLKELESEGAIVRDARGRFVTPEKLGLVRGTVQGHERGFAFLLREEGEDLFLPPRALHGALHKDVVLARPVGGERGDEAGGCDDGKRALIKQTSWRVLPGGNCMDTRKSLSSTGIN